MHIYTYAYSFSRYHRASRIYAIGNFIFRCPRCCPGCPSATVTCQSREFRAFAFLQFNNISLNESLKISEYRWRSRRARARFILHAINAEFGFGVRGGIWPIAENRPVIKWRSGPSHPPVISDTRPSERFIRLLPPAATSPRGHVDAAV